MKLNLIKCITLSLVMLCTSSFALDAPIPTNIQQSLSVNITNLDTNEVIYSYNDDVPRLIASNVKLFTTLFGLTYLGPDFHWHTKLKYSGKIHNQILDGNLYIQGGGDPILDSANMYQIISSLKRLDIVAINGNIIIDSSLFNDNPTYSMLQSNSYDSDKILPSGLVINGNRATFSFNISNNKIKVNSNLYNIKINNQLKLESKNIACDIDNTVTPIFNNNMVTIKGSISKACDNESANYYILKNLDYNKMVLNQVFNDFNIKISGQLQSGNTPRDAALIYDYISPSLEHVIIHMNKYSDNLNAMTIISSTGVFKSTNKSSFADGAKMYYTFLQSNGLLNQQFKLENGAGLSRYEYFSAKDVAKLLQLSNNSSLGVYLEASLPNAQGDGTLHNKFIEFGNRLKMKTGTLNDTRAYSGYFYNSDGTKYSVVFIANDLNTIAQKTNVEKFIDTLLQKLDNK